MGKYHEYYDKLNTGKKDYEDEIRRIQKKHNEFDCLGLPGIKPSFLDSKLTKVLEIGSGTGNHTKYLCDIAHKVYAVDTDPEMNEIAAKKLEGLPAKFYTSISDVPTSQFPLCIMMWHVLNYFPDLKTMINVFRDIHNKLNGDGIFIFDAWNGVAVIQDLPKHVTNKFEVGDQKIVHELRGSTDLMTQTTTILNHVEVYEDKQLVDQFTQEVSHYIWTAKTVVDCLAYCGFDTLEITKSGNYDIKADHTDWKVAYIARKNGMSTMS